MILFSAGCLINFWGQNRELLLDSKIFLERDRVSRSSMVAKLRGKTVLEGGIDFTRSPIFKVVFGDF